MINRNTAISAARSLAGRSSPLRLNFKWVRRLPDPDPPRRVSWSVYRIKLRLFSTHIGYVNASTRTDALARALAKWPAEPRLRVVHEAD